MKTIKEVKKDIAHIILKHSLADSKTSLTIADIILSIEIGEEEKKCYHYPDGKHEICPICKGTDIITCPVTIRGAIEERMKK